MSDASSEPVRDSGLLKAVGLMSGTSMDGIDIALIESDGRAALRLGPTGFEPYNRDGRSLLRAALAEAQSIAERTERPGALARAERMVTERHAVALARFLNDHALDRGSIAVVGFHGQTVLHRPRQRLTVQLGDGVELARRTGMRVVFDMRAADVAANGEGAPLVPAYHCALVRRAGIPGPVGILNIGGVANLTLVADGTGDPIACDTGPGNALLDDLMLARTGEPIDRDGAIAARGKVDENALAMLLADPYFLRPAPKSLDRNHFSIRPLAGLSLEDAAATLTAFTAGAVARTIEHLPMAPKSIVVCGGGARNPVLMRELARRLPCEVAAAEAFGWSIDAMEAQAFAYLAIRSLKGLPLTFPTTTGVARPMTGGVLAQP